MSGSKPHNRMLAPYLLVMASPVDDSFRSLGQLVAYLFSRREVIVNKWRSACEQDPTLSKVSALSREEFNNLLPLVLGILEERKPQEADPSLTAQAHGLHRWHNAHSWLDELNHLTQILYEELRLFGRLFPQVDKTLLLGDQQQVSQLMQEIINGRVIRYDELPHLQAMNRANALQQALDQMQVLLLQWDDLLRTSLHDLRGSIGIVNSAVYLLQTEGISGEERKIFMDMLSRNLVNVEVLLTNLMDLYRLESNQESLHVESVDAAQLLNEMVTSTQPIANQWGIVLKTDGPASLMVETDRVKLQRLVENLLLNALQSTPSTAGQAVILSVSWSQEGDYRWTFSIWDSEPSLPATTGLLDQQPCPTVERTSEIDPDQAEPVPVLPVGLPQIPPLNDMAFPIHPSQESEGLGLRIVKRLCELLGANLDVETQAGRCTLLRVRLPKQANG